MANAYGFFSGMDFDTYAAIEALNYSSIKHMKRSPMSYRYHKDNPTEPTPAMVLGSATHTVMLEPDLIGNFVVWGNQADEKVRRGKVWDNFQLRNAGSRIVTVEEYEYLLGMVTAVRKSKLAMKYIGAPGQSEVSAVWHDKAARRDMKARMDRRCTVEGRRTLIDLKTCRDARPFRFGNEAYRLGYHMQLAMYQEGEYYLTGELAQLIEIAVENKPPYEIAVYRVPTDVLQQGKDDLSRLIQRLSECERTNQWPPDLETETDLTLPSYAYGFEADDLSDLELIPA